MIHLYDHQQQSKDGAQNCYRRGVRRVLIQGATGSGKTQIGASVCHDAVARGHRTLWITHRRELIAQVSRAFGEHGLSFGVIAAGTRPNYRQPLQIASIDTLIRRIDDIPEPHFVCWDEAHHAPAATWARVSERYRNAWHLGLSASPLRLDGHGLGHFFDEMVCGPPIAWLIEHGYLSPYRMFAPATIDVSGLHTRAGDYAKDELAALMEKPAIYGDAVAHYKRFAAGRTALVFCVSIEASRELAQSFRSQGITAVHLDGKTDDMIRDSAIADLRAGRIKVISNVGLFAEGLDIVGLECVLQLRPTQSLALWLQMIGRGLRKSEGKRDCIILDAVGNCGRFGMPTDPVEWTLSHDQPKRRQTVKVKLCPQCYAALPPQTQRCPECGFDFPANRKPRTIDREDGELVELTPEQRAAQAVAARREQGMATSLEALIDIGRRRGYRNPAYWARQVLRGRQKAEA